MTSYFDELLVLPGDLERVFSGPTTDYVRARTTDDRQYLPGAHAGFVILYKDQNTQTRMNPYNELHRQLGCAPKVAMDWVVENARKTLPAHLQSTLPKCTKALTVHCGRCAVVNSRRPANAPARSEPRAFDQESVGRKFFFDTKYVKVLSNTEKHFIIGFICVNSGYVFTFNVQHKDDIYEVLDSLCQQLVDSHIFPSVTYDSLKTSIFVSDRAGEFMGSSFESVRNKWKFLSLHSAAYKHADMGPIEGLWNRLESRVRSFYASAPWMPHTTWPLAWDHAVWLHNRLAQTHAGIVRPPPYTCATGKNASLKHSLQFGTLVVCHNAVEAPARKKSELGKLYPRGRLGHYAGFDDEGNSYRIYDDDADDDFLSPWAQMDTNDAVTRRLISDYTPDDSSETPDYALVDYPSPPSNDLHDFNVYAVTNVSTDFFDKETVGVVEFQQDEASEHKTVMHAREFLTQASNLTSAYKKLTTFTQLLFLSTVNVYYPMFTQSQCNIAEELFPSIVVSIDSRTKNRGKTIKPIGLITYEFDKDGNVLVADIHDASKDEIALFSRTLLSLTSAGPLPDVKRSTHLNKLPPLPHNVDQAMLSPEWVHWQAAILNEIDGMFEQRRALGPTDTAELTQNEIDHACKLTWVFTRKMKDGEVVGYRARLCAQGFSQIWGVNFNKTHAGVVGNSTFNTILNLAVQMKMFHRHYDAVKAYLNAKLPNKILCKFPFGQTFAGMAYCFAYMCVYGLKQAGHHWHKLSHENIMAAEPRLTRSLIDPCFYFFVSTGLTIFILSNVDDYAIFSSDESWYADFERRYAKTSTKLTYEGPLVRWCGRDLKWNTDGSVDISQYHDIMEAVQSMPDISDMRPTDNPVESNFHAQSTVTPKTTAHDDPHAPNTFYPYKSALGNLLWYSGT
jgi:hypothetical protein